MVCLSRFYKRIVGLLVPICLFVTWCLRQSGGNFRRAPLILDKQQKIKQELWPLQLIVLPHLPTKINPWLDALHKKTKARANQVRALHRDQ